jgi:hypothetical protein
MKKISKASTRVFTVYDFVKYININRPFFSVLYFSHLLARRSNTYGLRLYCVRWLVQGITVFFIMALTSSLVSLPFTSKKAKTVILNTVEEEALNNAGNFNEEHKSGKIPQCQFLDYAAFLAQQNMQEKTFLIPRSVNFLSSDYSRKMIQPPDC